MKLLDLASGTDTGKQRQDNQDRFIAKKLWADGQVLIGVIDGVGGYEGGDVAATIAKEAIEEYMSAPKGDALSMLKEAVIIANNQIIGRKESNPHLSQMCCVLTIAVADAKKQTAQYVHVGDTRLYQFRNGGLEKITNDHSLVGVREDAGELSEEEAMRHPRRNIILRQVGTEIHRIDDPEFLEYGEVNFFSNDLLLICSDGLSDLATRDQITTLLSKKEPLHATINSLLAKANEEGGTDNITVVIAKNLSKAKPPKQIETVAGPVPDLQEAIIQQEEKNIEESNTTKNSSNKLTNILLITLLLAMVALGIIWLTRKPSARVPQPVNAQTDSTSAAIRTPKDSLMNLSPDTIRLKTTIELNKSGLVTGSKIKTTVLVPDSSFTDGTAIKIVNSSLKNGNPDTIYLKDLIILGFETGISTEGKNILCLDNVQFKNVKHAVSYSGTDSTKIKYLRFD